MSSRSAPPSRPRRPPHTTPLGVDLASVHLAHELARNLARPPLVVQQPHAPRPPPPAPTPPRPQRHVRKALRRRMPTLQPQSLDRFARLCACLRERLAGPPAQRHRKRVHLPNSRPVVHTDMAAENV